MNYKVDNFIKNVDVSNLKSKFIMFSSYRNDYTIILRISILEMILQNYKYNIVLYLVLIILYLGQLHKL